MSTARDGLGVTIGLKVKSPHPQPLSRGERGAGRRRRGGTVIGAATVRCGLTPPVTLGSDRGSGEFSRVTPPTDVGGSLIL